MLDDRQEDASWHNDTPDTPDEPLEPASASLWRSGWGRLRVWAHPPNVTVWAPPTWEQIRWRGEHGEHVSREGWPRSGSAAWARVHQAVRAVLAWVDWVFASFSRFVVAAVLYTLLAHLPWLSWLLPWPAFLP